MTKTLSDSLHYLHYHKQVQERTVELLLKQPNENLQALHGETCRETDTN